MEIYSKKTKGVIIFVLAYRACHKGRDNQDDVAIGQRMFYLGDSMLQINWLDIPCIVICHFLFAPNLEWLVTKTPEGICSHLYFYAHLTRKSNCSC